MCNQAEEGSVVPVAGELPDMGSSVIRNFLLNLNPPPLREIPHDFMIRVNRNNHTILPERANHFARNKLEIALSEYDLSKRVELWLHHRQKDRSVTGNVIFRDLLSDPDASESFLSWWDGLVIQRRGVSEFRKLFGCKAVFLWGVLIRERDDNFSVPFLHADVDTVVLRRRWLCDVWGPTDPALRLRKSEPFTWPR